jgi:uncharacterized protein (DUF1800 family)
MDQRAAHAMIRFGLGRRGAETPPADPQAWLARQLDGPDPGLAAPGHSILDGLAAVHLAQVNKGMPGRAKQMRDIFREDNAAAIGQLLTTAAPFRERLVWFWANHFTVSIRKPIEMAMVNAYMREAIRPHVTGRFGDMLLAVMRHPAMLYYLDNGTSIGPDSPFGQRRQRGLNENLARECLELHTVTPAAGYSQADVTAFARVLTGWSLSFEPRNAGFVFRNPTHEPGQKVVMGQRYDAGEQEGVRALAWLAAHPATAHNLATKLVRHFVADTPPPAAVARIEAVLRQTGGDLRAASLALIDLPEAWQPLAKLRSPFDYTVAVLRALDLSDASRPDLVETLAALGQPLHNAPLPNGWADTAADWASAEAMMRRIDWAYATAAKADGASPVTLADNSLGQLLPAPTRDQIARAGSQREAVTLLLASPEFQRR